MCCRVTYVYTDRRGNKCKTTSKEHFQRAVDENAVEAFSEKHGYRPVKAPRTYSLMQRLGCKS